MKPKRIQRKRTKGWKMPPNTIYVGRPSKWGNLYYLVNLGGVIMIRRKGSQHFISGKENKTRQDLFDLYKEIINHSIFGDPLHGELIKHELKGKNLCCWCPLDQPCHADILLEIAKGKA